MTVSVPPPVKTAPAFRRSWQRRLLLGMLIALLPFLLLEVGLRVCGIGADETDVHSGVVNPVCLFELTDDGTRYRTRLSHLQFFVSQEFSREPADDEFRIFVLGGSTVQGRPFSTETAFPAWLEEHLNAAYTDRRFVCVNCGGVSYASYRLRPVLQEVLTYQPDLIILATGHNEFLEDRTYHSVKSRSPLRLKLEQAASQIRTVVVLRRLLGGAPRVEPTTDDCVPTNTVEARLDDDDGYASYHRDSEWHSQVRQQFTDAVQSMATACNDADVPLLLVELGANLSDCPPFKSEAASQLTVDERNAWQSLFDQATFLQETDPEQALAVYQDAAEIDSSFALLHFRIGRCQQRLGLISAARTSYQRALDEDVCPLRMTSPLHDALRSLADKEGIPLLNAAEILETVDEAKRGVPGHDLYLDHVHPTVGAHQQLARAIAQRLVDADIVDQRVETHLNELPEQPALQRQLYREHVQSLPAAWFSNGGRRIGWLENWAQRQRLLEETLPRNDADRIASAVRSLQLGNRPAAAGRLGEVDGRQPENTLLLLRNAAALFGEGQTASADWLVREARALCEADNMLPGIDLAELVLAVERQDGAAVRELFARHAGGWKHIVREDETRWARQMPDVAERAAQP